jgi:hypothetical protein
MKGKTGALTQTRSVVLSGITRFESFAPIVTLAAMRASGTPVDFATNGKVREPRGFTSRTYNSFSHIAY